MNERFQVLGMHCSACEKTIAAAIRKLTGVIAVQVNYVTQDVWVEYDPKLCSRKRIREAIEAAGYTLGSPNRSNLIGMAVVAAVVLFLSSYTGGFDLEANLQKEVTYLILFVLGVFTSLHCIGMCGGVMLSQSIGDAGQGKFTALRPTLAYNFGRVVSYTIIGGLVGALGTVLSLSLPMQAGITMFAGLFMVVMGLNMAGFSFLRRLQLRLPSMCAGNQQGRAPFTIGLLNGLMPCGPLQTMQLYALGTGSALEGATVMFLFALGTVPLMLPFGLAAGMLSKGHTKKILQFSGVLVLILGLIMANRGLALAGFNYLPFTGSKLAATGNKAIAKAQIVDGVQIVQTVANDAGYQPSVLFIQKGIPVRWLINGQQINSCNNAIVIPALNIKKKLQQGETVIEFTPGDSDINFSCWMGMINGVFKVVDNLDTVDVAKVDVAIPPASGCCSSGNNCCSPDASSQQPSIYGEDISKVPAARLIRQATLTEDGQRIEVKGIDRELEPLVLLLQQKSMTKMTIDLSDFAEPQGRYEIVNQKTKDRLIRFDGKPGLNSLQFRTAGPGVYFILKNGALLGAVEVVEDVAKMDLEAVKERYF